MSNLSITSVTFLGHTTSAGTPVIEISGEWKGEETPPRVVRNFYKDQDGHLLQDIFYQSEYEQQTPITPFYSIGSRVPLTYTQGAKHSIVSYKLIETKDVTSVEVLSDFVFGQDEDEYTTWNLVARQMESIDRTL